MGIKVAAIDDGSVAMRGAVEVLSLSAVADMPKSVAVLVHLLTSCRMSGRPRAQAVERSNRVDCEQAAMALAAGDR